MQNDPDNQLEITPEIITPVSQVLLIDLENCPNQISKLLNDLEQFSHVVICYAQSGAKIPLDWLLPLTTMINANKLKIQKMPETGKNAADFGISFFAGAMMQQLPIQTHFVIMSEDTDLDHVIRLLKSQGRTAIRINTKHDPTTTKEASVASYCQALLLHKNNRPAKKESLLNSLKAHCGQDVTKADAIFQCLLQQHAIVLTTDDKLSYNNIKLAELMSTADSS